MKKLLLVFLVVFGYANFNLEFEVNKKAATGYFKYISVENETIALKNITKKILQNRDYKNYSSFVNKKALDVIKNLNTLLNKIKFQNNPYFLDLSTKLKNTLKNISFESGFFDLAHNINYSLDRKINNLNILKGINKNLAKLFEKYLRDLKAVGVDSKVIASLKRVYLKLK